MGTDGRVEGRRALMGTDGRVEVRRALMGTGQDVAASFEQPIILFAVFWAREFGK